MTIARDLANVASLMVSSSANVVFDDSVALTSGVANGVLYLNGSKTATSSAALSYDGANLVFGSTAQRIRGDMSNATFSNRLAFQSSTTNGVTTVYALPNGTATFSAYRVFNNADPTNAAFLELGANGSTDVRIQSGIHGTGTYLPMTFYTGGSERFRVANTGAFGLSGTNYGTAGQVLTSAGANSTPTWTTPSGTPDFILQAYGVI